jgi:hypothetical protein
MIKRKVKDSATAAFLHTEILQESNSQSGKATINGMTAGT